MPAKRRVLDRARRPSVTPEALAVWRRCRELERAGATKSREYSDLGRKLCGLVGLCWTSMMWPTDCTSATVPANLRHRELQAESYRQAYAARCALLEAEAAADREAEAE